MISRKLSKNLFQKSTFLLGPRKVGKSTFLKTNFTQSLFIDLLDNSRYENFIKNPGRFYEEIQYQINKNPTFRKHPIIIDEIQRIPMLLNEVHRLIEEKGLRFILCGSSARKLLRGGANLLGGRAGRIEMRGLSLSEIHNVDIITYINNGGIPEHYLSQEPQAQIKSYVQNYIQEEIKAEALVRNLRSFYRFLDLVAITNGEEVNYSNIARDVGVDVKTIIEYFQILIDTLLGTYVEPYFDKKKRTNILKSPKFYFFDTGVVNYLKGITIHKQIGTEFGRAFEHIIYNELMMYKNYTMANYDTSFWRTYEQNEVDFILGDAEIAIEVKSSQHVDNKDLKNSVKFKEIYKPKKSIVVCNERFPRLTEHGIEILPYCEFVDVLWAGGIV